MTYLQLLNAVLTRLRDDTVTTVTGGDEITGMIADLVNDAKRTVEQSHAWNCLRDDWTVNTADGTATYPLTGAGKWAKIESIYGSGGRELREAPLADIRKKAAASPANDQPIYYAVDGETSGDVRLRFFPTPDAVEVLTVYGYKNQADLSADSDVLLVPHQPVVYLAYALAARERGEVGGQTSAEIFAMAAQYLKDAIALDASMNDFDNIWTTV